MHKLSQLSKNVLTLVRSNAVFSTRQTESGFGFQMTALPANHQVTTVNKKWRINAKIDKSSLRPEVRSFCAQYPVFSLYEYTPDSIAVEMEHLGGKYLF